MKVLYIVAILLLLFSTLTKKLKKSTVIFAIVVIVLLNLGIKNVLDLYNYHRNYENLTAISFEREIGFQILRLAFKFFNKDFFYFKMSMLIISIICMVIYVKQINNNNISFFMLLYMLYFAFMDAEQIRNFYAVIILIFAFKYLFYDNASSTIKYIALILLASSIHTSFIIYLFLLIAKSKSDIIKLVLRLFPILVILTIFLIRYTNIQQIMMNIFLSTDDSRNDLYSNLTTKLGWIAPATIYLYNVFLIRYCYSLVKNKNDYYTIKKYTLRGTTITKNIEKIPMDYIWKRLYLINIVGLMFIPLYMNTLVFYRLNRNLILINIIFINSIYNYHRENKTKYIKILFLTFIIIIGYWIFDFYIYNSWENFYNAYFVNRKMINIL